MNADLRSASLSWEWRGEALRGDAALTLAEYGQVRGSFQLPLPARFPVALDRKGPLRASLTAQVREKGLLSALFPGFIRESRGDIDADLRVGGTWEEPEIGGSLKLAGAGAYLPSAGIQVKRRPACDAPGKGARPHRFLPGGVRSRPYRGDGPRPAQGVAGGRLRGEASPASGSRPSTSPSCRS